MKAVMSASGRVQAAFDQVENNQSRINLFAVLMPGGGWKNVRGRGAILISMLTTLEPTAFRKEIWERVAWKGQVFG